jgi:hypothetical protein
LRIQQIQINSRLSSDSMFKKIKVAWQIETMSRKGRTITVFPLYDSLLHPK